MNEITCEVICDLLPLYAEGEASSDSCALVETHLAACPACAAALEKLKEPLILPPVTEQRAIAQLRRKKRRRTLRNIGIAALALLLLGALAAYWLLPSSAAALDATDVTVVLGTDGNTYLQLSDRATGGLVSAVYTQDANGNTTMYLTLSATASSRLEKRLYADQYQQYGEDSERCFLLDAYAVSWTFEASAVTGVSYQYSGMIGPCERLLIGDSVTAIYYQPGVDQEIASFYTYMDGLIDTAFDTVSGSGITWTAEQLAQLTYSHYQVPDSAERVLLWSEEIVD
ncbi:MAG: zf-HC2 domain-containing protein [Clostridiales bacterium]|nr:zf-HC2 domain-containing protein [Clostridiales bacterium]